MRFKDRHVFYSDIDVTDSIIAPAKFRVALFSNSEKSFPGGPTKTYLCRSPCAIGSQSTYDSIVMVGKFSRRGISLYLYAKAFRYSMSMDG